MVSKVIERHHYFRLHSEYAAPETRTKLGQRTLEALQDIPGVLSITVGQPADEHAKAAWDLALCIRFANLEDVEAYRVHPDHRRFVDEVLAPAIAVKKVWNFTVQDPEQG